MNTPLAKHIATEDAIEAMAFVNLYDVTSKQLRDEERFECLPISNGCAISLPKAPAIGLNRILGLNLVSDLEKSYKWMSEKTGKRFLQLNVNTASDAVKRWVQSKDLVEHGPGWAKLSRSAPFGHFPPSGHVRNRKVQPDEAHIFGSMMCEGFGFPQSLITLWSAIVGKDGWSCFFALDGEMPIGTGAMYAAGAYAWLGGGTTLPAFRNRGVQKGLIHARMEDGMARGVSTFVVETEVPSPGKPNISYTNLKKAGFEHIYNRSNFIL